jgi:hypothetical protein
MNTSQTRLRASPIAALVNRVVPLTFTEEISPLIVAARETLDKVSISTGI